MLWTNPLIGLGCLAALAGCDRARDTARADADRGELANAPSAETTPAVGEALEPKWPLAANGTDAQARTALDQRRDERDDERVEEDGGVTGEQLPTSDDASRNFERRFLVMPPLHEWDEDADESLSRAEFISGLFAWWDADESRSISIYEFQSGAATWFEDAYTHGTFKAWDDDGDGMLSFEEFSERVRNARVFDQWDSNEDGRIGDNELTYILYRGWDIDRDEKADIETWRTW